MTDREACTSTNAATVMDGPSPASTVPTGPDEAAGSSGESRSPAGISPAGLRHTRHPDRVSRLLPATWTATSRRSWPTARRASRCRATGSDACRWRVSPGRRPCRGRSADLSLNHLKPSEPRALTAGCDTRSKIRTLDREVCLMTSYAILGPLELRLEAGTARRRRSAWGASSP